MSNFRVIQGTISGPVGKVFVVGDVLSAEDLRAVGVDRAVEAKAVTETDETRRVLAEQDLGKAVLIGANVLAAESVEEPSVKPMPKPKVLKGGSTPRDITNED